MHPKRIIRRKLLILLLAAANTIGVFGGEQHLHSSPIKQETPRPISRPNLYAEEETSSTENELARQQFAQERPQPYDFGYTIQDEYGNTQFRTEQGDASGNVKGTYGYTDAYGIYRRVGYIADQNGFRAEVKSNEPGVKADHPADVFFNVEEPPRGVVESSSRPFVPNTRGGSGSDGRRLAPGTRRFTPFSRGFPGSSASSAAGAAKSASAASSSAASAAASSAASASRRRR